MLKKPFGWTKPPCYPEMQGNKDSAMFLLREIEDSTGYAPNMHHYRAVALAFVNAGDEDGAFRVLTEFHTKNRPKDEHAEADESRSGGSVNVENGDDVLSFSRPCRPSANGYVVESRNGDAAQEVGEAGLPKHAGVSEGLPFSTDDSFPTRPLRSAVSGPQDQARGPRSKRSVLRPPGQLASLASALAIDGDWARCLELLEDAKHGAVAAVESVREMRTRALRNSAATGQGMCTMRMFTCRLRCCIWLLGMAVLGSVTFGRTAQFPIVCMVYVGVCFLVDDVEESALSQLQVAHPHWFAEPTPK